MGRDRDRHPPGHLAVDARRRAAGRGRPRALFADPPSRAAARSGEQGDPRRLARAARARVRGRRGGRVVSPALRARPRRRGELPRWRRRRLGRRRCRRGRTHHRCGARRAPGERPARPGGPRSARRSVPRGAGRAAHPVEQGPALLAVPFRVGPAHGTRRQRRARGAPAYRGSRTPLAGLRELPRRAAPPAHPAAGRRPAAHLLQAGDHRGRGGSRFGTSTPRTSPGST